MFRFKCGRGCGAEYANKHYVKAKIHAVDCPTRAFLASSWRPPAKSWVAEKGFMIRDADALDAECCCPLPCKAAHLIDD